MENKQSETVVEKPAGPVAMLKESLKWDFFLGIKIRNEFGPYGFSG